MLTLSRTVPLSSSRPRLATPPPLAPAPTPSTARTSASSRDAPRPMPMAAATIATPVEVPPPAAAADSSRAARAARELAAVALSDSRVDVAVPPVDVVAPRPVLPRWEDPLSWTNNYPHGSLGTCSETKPSRVADKVVGRRLELVILDYSGIARPLVPGWS